MRYVLEFPPFHIQGKWYTLTELGSSEAGIKAKFQSKSRIPHSQSYMVKHVALPCFVLYAMSSLQDTLLIIKPVWGTY